MWADRIKIAWAVTGAGHFLRESADLIKAFADRAEIHVCLSLAAAEVVRMYKLEETIAGSAASVTRESGHSFPLTSKFSVGFYAALVIAPATGNTVAKCAQGIADSLVSCMFAQAGKSRVPVCVLPTDVAPEIISPAPNGNMVKVFPRDLDLGLTKRLGEIGGVTLCLSPAELGEWLNELAESSS
jgi:flavoprotein